MAINKVVIGENTIIDISDASLDLSSSDITSGKIAYDGNGDKITGTGQTQIEGPTDGSLADGTATKYYVKRGITEIRDYAFYSGSAESTSGFNMIQEYDIPSTITNIGECSFTNNNSLTKISDTINVTAIGNYAFSNCIKLNEINTENVTSVGNYAFYNCTNLNEINTENVTSIGTQTFSGCKSLNEINIINVSSIGESAFKGCIKLISIDASSTTSVGKTAFQECSDLESVNISNSSTIGAGAFYNCTKLTNIQVKNGVKISPYSQSTKIATVNEHIFTQYGTSTNNIYMDGNQIGVLKSSNLTFTSDIYTFTRTSSSTDFTMSWTE